MSARRRTARRTLAAAVVLAALPASSAVAVTASDYVGHPRLDGASALPPEHQGRSDAAWRTSDEPATPSVVRTVATNDGTDLFPVLPGAVVLLAVAGGAGFSLARMGVQRPGLSH